MSRASLMVRTSVAVAAALVFLGCSKSNSSAPQINALGAHPAGWVDNHWVAFNQDHASCTPCHGSYSVAANSGGIAQVSCFGCHHPNGPLHPAGWSAPGQHGVLGAKAAASSTAGFAHCAACHGAGYNNPVSIPGSPVFTCFTCHVDEAGVATNSPHPAAPWHGTTASGTNHATTDPSNAPECAKCHLGGANLDPADLAFHGTAPAGTAPGCFNNTLCHGNNPGHIAGWALPTAHGLKGAMAAPGATTGFAACVTCHGASFTGGTGTSCLACHTTAPHPAKPWNNVNSSTNSHDLTNQANAPVCFQCHAAGTNSDLKPSAAPAPGAAPGCLNNTMCHGNNP